MKLRAECPEIARGTVEVIESPIDSVAILKKTNNGSSVYIAINFSNEKQQVTLNTDIAIHKTIGQLSVDEESTAKIKETGAQLLLAPRGIIVLG